MNTAAARTIDPQVAAASPLGPSRAGQVHRPSPASSAPASWWVGDCTCTGWPPIEWPHEEPQVTRAPAVRVVSLGPMPAPERPHLRPAAHAADPIPALGLPKLISTLADVAAMALRGGFAPLVALPITCAPNAKLEQALQHLGTIGGAVVVPVAVAPGTTGPYPALLAQRHEHIIPIGGDHAPGAWSWLAPTRWGHLRVCACRAHVQSAAHALAAAWRRQGSLAAGLTQLRQRWDTQTPTRETPSTPVLEPAGPAAPIVEEPQSASAEQPLEIAFRWMPSLVAAQSSCLVTFRAYGGPSGCRLHVQANDRPPFGITVGPGGPYTVVEVMPAKSLVPGVNVLRFAATTTDGKRAPVRLDSVLVQPFRAAGQS